MRKAIVEAVEIGGSYRMAVASVGIGYSTFTTERRTNKAFALQLEKAKASRFHSIHAAIQQRLEKSKLHELAYLLKVLYPDLYATKKEVKHKGAVNHVHGGTVNVQQLLIELDSSRAVELEQLARSRLASGHASELCPPRQPGTVDSTATPIGD